MASTRSRKKSRAGLALMTVGLMLAALSAFAGGASAEGTTQVCTPSLEVQWGLDAPGYINLDGLLAGNSTVVGNDDLTVTLSNAKPITGQSLTVLTIGSLDFATSKPVTSVVVRLWQSPGNYIFKTVNYSPAVTKGSYTSPAGSHPEFGQAPIKGLTFCYEKAVVATSTTQAPTTTKAPTTTAVQVVPDVITTTTTAAPAVVPEVEVLPQVVTAPTETQPQLAFTGSDSKPLLLVGGLLLVLGLSLVTVDRIGLVRKGRHSR